MSKTAGDVLKWAVAGLEDSSPPRTIGFLTLTLPSDDLEFIHKCQESWAEIVRQFIQSLKRELKKHGSTFPTVLGCVEIHPGRSSRLSTNVPHIHLVFRCRERPGTPYYLTPGCIRGIWKRIVDGATGITGIDYRSSENLVLVRRSVRRYLAKYLSKGVGGHAGSESRAGWHPSSFTIVPRLIRSAYRSMTLRSPSLIPFLEDGIDALKPGSGYVRVFQLDVGDRKVNWATYGYLDELYRPPPAELLTSNVVRKRRRSQMS